MNREEIIRMARGAVRLPGPQTPQEEAIERALAPIFERFAAAVAKHEREACAKVCDVLAVHPEYASDITKVAAQAIRARGNT